MQRKSRLAVLVVLCAGAVGVAHGQGQIPDGMWVGKWVLSPRFNFGYQTDSNVFRRSSAEEPSTDRIQQYTGGLRATLPFRVSLLQFDYEATRYSYRNNVFPRNLVQVAGVTLNLNFSTGDQLILREQYRRGFESFQDVDPGGELQFEGQPYNLNRWEVELSRSIPDRQGYSIRVARVDFNYDTQAGSTGPSFFDYRGFDNAFEYRQPMAGSRWLTLQYGTRRINNYESNRPDRVGVPFRKEVSDRLEAGVRGLLGENMPYYVQVGWARLDYKGGDESKFRGLSGSGSARLRTGGGLDVEMQAARRVLPSSFETYYINNELRATVEHAWNVAATATIGGGLVYDYNEYGESAASDCDPSPRVDTRRDSRYALSGLAGWKVHRLVELQLMVTREARSSNCDLVDYKTLVVSTGVRLGWN